MTAAEVVLCSFPMGDGKSMVAITQQVAVQETVAGGTPTGDLPEAVDAPPARVVEDDDADDCRLTVVTAPVQPIRTTTVVRRMRFMRPAHDGGWESSEVQSEMMLKVSSPLQALGCLTPAANFADTRTLVTPYHRLCVVGAAWCEPAGRMGECTPVRGSYRRALFLGVGGGALPQFWMSATGKKGFWVDLVEHDAGVAALAARFFGLSTSLKCSMYVTEAASFVADAVRVGATYDMIVVDLCTSGGDAGTSLMAPPLAVRTPEFVAHLRSVLSAEGVVMFNMAPRSEDTDGKAVQREMRLFIDLVLTQFEDAEVLYTPLASNRMLVAWNHTVEREHKRHRSPPAGGMVPRHRYDRPEVGVLDRVRKLCATSSVIARCLTGFPVLVDMFLSPDHDYLRNQEAAATTASVTTTPAAKPTRAE